MDTQNLAIMFTDLAGFTAKTSTQSREELEYLLDKQDDIVVPVIEQHNGTIVKTIGDAFMVSFNSPTNAVLCGVHIQQAINNHNDTVGDDHKMTMRIAVNSGEVNVKKGDVFGEPVNIASRIEAIAEPGEVYFTESVYLSMNKNEIPSASVGEKHLKGIAGTVRVYKVIQKEGALDEHVQKRRASAHATSKLPKNNLKGFNKFSSRPSLIVIASLLGLGALLMFILLSNPEQEGTKSLTNTPQQQNDDSVVTDVIHSKYPSVTIPDTILDSLNTRQKQQIQELLQTPISELTDRQKKTLRDLEQRIKNEE